ncbi:peptidoglycan DD-metalloendopeptidase family protein [Brevundimonas sp. AJA228-03]|uniref:murein hydrolase activator EnvC family protein n=1 Tax=Brevundimonas sp. AJA228-03 TaxID=2752515 RepID=UPI001ADF8DEF|nr:peptidoglycan DD-metalloendopeptidase family protein [Brevundimonas sp. AJA228-03]QTN19916.1 peptidoglycan DD-metalloendopeptidase family protein [Brevundimonas sp. AJA228-03]
MNRPALLSLMIALSALPAAASVQDDLELLQARYRDEVVRARRLRADAAEAAVSLAALDRQLTSLRRDQTADDVQMSAQRQRLRDLSRREAVLVTELARTRDAQGRLFSALQMMSRKPPPPLLVPADRAVDTVRAAILMKAMAPALQRRAAGFDARQAEVRRIRRLAVLASERLLTSESTQGDRRAEIEDLVARRSALLAVLKADADRAERASAALETRIRNLGGRPADIVPSRDATPAMRLPAGRARLTPPVSGSPTVRFGRGSSGWRWPSSAGPVASPAAARVDYAGPLNGWGQVVILDLGPGWRAVIAGLDGVSVASGDRIADGQSVGTGTAGGEVYLELRREDRPVDPAPYL